MHNCLRAGWMAVLLVVAVLCCEAKEKGAAQGEKDTKVYLFGVSQQLTDSVVYITGIDEVEGLQLDRKTKMLPYRAVFSLQMKEYVEGTLKQNHQTACVFFSKNRKKLSRKYYKIKKRFLDNSYTKLVPIEGFTFRLE